MPTSPSPQASRIRLLSVVIPLYNEARTIVRVLEAVQEAPLPTGIGREVVVVDDGSADGSADVVAAYAASNPALGVRLLRHAHNQGKGAALHTGIAAASGDYIVVQDADLEYDPTDYAKLLQPVLKANADVVYGSRFIGGEPHRILFFWHSIGNKLLTFLSNAFNDLNLTDMETGAKLFRRELLQGLMLREKRFGFEPEVTAKMARIPGVRVYEVGVSYYGRTYAEGKKINWRDGLWALWCIVRYGLFS
ncbi:glycosyltransferase family 2 protein [Solirubrum puertoriconensis]|uniref:glycosyltransferase family 2 protein n=1 Tax=Solirubrum puertoriconensis TaxID=1751427 RepID=UPI00256FF27C|nr:glycosyltransferase family 2 protein [Solirubrum puertoriconensis]